MTTNHGPPWGAVRVHCTHAARAVRVHCTGAPRYNAGGARFDSPDCTRQTTLYSFKLELYNVYMMSVADPSFTGPLFT